MNLNDKLKEMSKTMQKNNIKIMGSVINENREIKNVYSLITKHDSIVMREETFKGFVDQCIKAIREGNKLKEKAVNRNNTFLA